MWIILKKLSRYTAFLFSFSVLLVNACNSESDKFEFVKAEDVWLNASKDYGEFSLTGSVVDEVGMPLNHVIVVLCSSVCRPVSTNEEGKYVFADIKSGFYVLDVRGDDAPHYRRSSLVFPVKVSKKTERLRPVVLFPISPGIGRENDTAVDIGGLKIVTDGATNILMPDGVKIPPEYWPSYKLEKGGRKYVPLAMWALSPFGENELGNLFLKGAYIDRAWSGDVAFFLVNLETSSCDWIGNATMVEGSVTNKEFPLKTLSWVILAKQG